MTAMTAISGLLINKHYIDIISNNIANASTIGYKSIQPIFFDVFSSRSMNSNTTNGSGVGISNIIQNFRNGTLMETGRDLDLGIIQDGFFRVLDAQGHVHYTRNGQFLIDEHKNIINVQGMYLTGYNKSYPKNIAHNAYNLEPINLKHAYTLQSKPTSTIKLSRILNSNPEDSTNNKNDFDENDLSEQSNHVNNITIYNKDNKPEKLNISFKKIDQNTWNVQVQSDGYLDEKNEKEKSINSSFDLKFDSNGELISKKLWDIQSENSKYKNMTLDLTGTVEQSDNENDFPEFSQDGYSQGSLKTFDILPNGEIIGTYSNEKTVSIGQILLSKFISPEKLNPESGNLWSATEASGQGEIGVAGDSGFGTLTNKTLETSNVDLNKELINMIIAQRNYQSNAQSFKTEDKIINTLLNLR